MGFHKRLAVVFVVVALKAAHQDANIRKSGWLSRVVEQRKAQFLNDVGILPPIQIKASLIQAPEGYVDPPGWDFKSVVRLLFLIRQSKESRPVFRQLRRMLSPVTRRLYSVNTAYSYLAFPNIDSKNYYDHAYFSQEYMDHIHLEDLYHVNNSLDDNSVIIVANPVEARLPSARISVLMLKQIMEARALGNRVMPTTPQSTISWSPMNHSTTEGGGNATNTTSSGEDGNSTDHTGSGSDNTGSSDGSQDTDGSSGTENGNSTGFLRTDPAPREPPVTKKHKRKSLRHKKSRKGLSRKQNEFKKSKMSLKEHEQYLESLAMPRNWWDT